MRKKILINLSILLVTGLTGCSSLTSTSSTHRPQASGSYTIALWDGNAATIWSKLQRQSTAKLADMQAKTTDPDERAWLQLAILIKQKNMSTQQLATALLTWREQNPNHLANQLLPSNSSLTQLQNAIPPKQIAVLLPESGQYGASARAVRDGFLNAYYANQPALGKQNIKFYDTTQIKDISLLYQRAINDGADFIIGPLAKENVQTLGKMREFNSPTLALNYTEENKRATNFYEFGLLPEDEAAQIATRAHEAGLTKAIVIAPENMWGKRLVAAFNTAWQTDGGQITDTWYFSNRLNFNQEVAALLKVDTTTDKKLTRKKNKKDVLEKQRRQDFDVIFVFAQPQDARIIVPLLHYYYAGNTPIYATSSVYANKNAEKNVDLNGVIICDIPWNMRMQNNSDDTASANRLYAVGQDAYLLSQSLQRLTLLQNFPVYGTTGALTLSEQNQIHRRLPCASIHHGVL